MRPCQAEVVGQSFHGKSMNKNLRTRFVGIRIRSLRTTKGEERPSEVCILNPDGSSERFDLCDQQAEVDFLLGKVPVDWRKVRQGETIGPNAFIPHHLVWKAIKPEEVALARAEGRMLREAPSAERGGEPSWYVLDKIPTSFFGLQPGDQVAMGFGGAGGEFARDTVEYWEGRGLEVWRISPHRLKAMREAAGRSRGDDAELLAMILRDHPEFFHFVRPIDTATVSLAVVFDARQEAMRQRIRVGNRLAGRARNALLRERRAGHPVSTLEAAVEAAKASDALYQNLVVEEARAQRELAKLLEQIEIWGVLSTVEGIGVSIGARIIAGVGDIRRFMAEPDEAALAPLKASLDQFMKEAGYEALKAGMDQAALARAKNGFERAVTVRTHCLGRGLTAQAELLQRALKVMKELRRRERRADGEAGFIAYCGLHVLPDGRFVRRRSGETANWSSVLRQAFYLLTEQFNRRPNTEWGRKLLENKARLRERHPEVVVVDGKRRYTSGHILKMARWRTATQVARWVFREWTRLERARTAA